MNDDFFESLKQTITETADVVTKKTGSIVEVQKIKGKIYNVRRSLDDTYKVLGEKVYSNFMDGDSMDSETAGLCDKITKLYAQIDELKDEMAQVRGECICPACGANNPLSAAYCMSCGKELVKETAENKSEDIFDDFDEDSVFETVHEEKKEEAVEEPQTEESCGCQEESCGCQEESCGCQEEAAPEKEDK